MLSRDLDTSEREIPNEPAPALRGRLGDRLFRAFFWIDAHREWFRDAFMRSVQQLRRRVLECGTRLCATGKLSVPEDIFWLRGDDLAGTQPWREVVTAARARHAALHNIAFPVTATRELLEAMLALLEAMLATKEGAPANAPASAAFPGIALSPAVIEGRVLKANDLMTLLAEIASAPIAANSILVVPSLEPSWAVLFPRVAGVVAEIGGELSHASILLREARKPALVNCTGIFWRVQNGDRLRLDGKRGVAMLISSRQDG